MSRFKRAMLGLAAAGLAVTGIAVAPQLGSAAPAKATVHTLKLAAHSTANHDFPPNKFVGAETDRDPATGKLRGYDTFSDKINLKTGAEKIDLSVALKGGLITAHFGRGADGKITGGTGRYQTIKGTVHFQSNAGSKVTHYTFKYTL